MSSLRESNHHFNSCDSEADMYRGIFKFGVFNAVQSKCYDTVSAHIFDASSLSMRHVEDREYKRKSGASFSFVCVVALSLQDIIGCQW